MTSELINEIVRYRQLLDEIDAIRDLHLRHGDQTFTICGPVTVGGLIMAFRFFQIQEVRK